MVRSKWWAVAVMTLALFAGCSLANTPEEPVPPGVTSGGGSPVGGSGSGGSGGSEGCGALTTLDNCGACDTKCQPENAAGATCMSGSCDYADCSTGFQDCDDERANGCESEAASDLDHCGGCNNKCEPINATSPSCTAGECVYGECETGFQDCDGDPANGCESELASDVAHCGACDAPCDSMLIQNVENVTCTDSQCGYDTCLALFDDCDQDGANGCELAIDTVSDCGSCSNDCGAPNNGTAMCDAGQCAIDMCTMPFADCDKDFSNGCELDTQSDAKHCGGCNIACPPTKSHCVGGMCTNAATCQAILTTQNMWGQTAKGVDLRAWTNSTLHYLGCNGNGCSAASFFCNDDPNAQTLEFGSTGTVRAVVDPDNKEGDKMPTNNSGCCSANDPLGICNGPDANNNSVNIDNAKALCNALGYQNGVLVASGPSNSCPEAHALTADGTKWSSDYVSSDGYGRHWKCSVFK